jgi:hypothetical protein
MKLDAFLATIIIVSFLITIVMAVASYGAYKLRERRQPVTDRAVTAGERTFFERVDVSDFEEEKQRARHA